MYLIVAAGGALGAMARYGTDSAVGRWTGFGFPWGTVTVNLVAPMLLTRLLLEAVRRARGTHVFVNSGSGLKANPGWAAYNASKFGLRGFADALRQEEAEHEVRVSSIYPGRTATRMQEQVHSQEGKTYDPDAWIRPETVAEEIVRVLDLSRDATVPDVVIRPT